MKRDMDLIRDILIKVEENDGKLFIKGNVGEEEYERDCYHVELLKEAGFLVANITKTDGGIYYSVSISRLTWEGHNFLDNIRSDTVWKKVKSRLAKVGETASIEVISKIATTIVTQLALSGLS